MNNRIPPPILTAFSIGLIWAATKSLPITTFSFGGAKAIGIAVFILGLVMLLWAGVLFKREATTVNPFRPSKTSLILTHGPYKFTRNPMYLGMMLLIVGTGLFWTNWATIPIVLAFWLYMNETQIKPEERALSEKFGKEYTAYLQTVRRWL